MHGLICYHVDMVTGLRNSCSISKAAEIIKGTESEIERIINMSGRCEICERKPLYGNNSNFSQKRTRRRFVLNVHRRRLE
ncbi:MAG TPA: bL28 family ribosomal protein, partial [Ktedonobacteraceae bacterium]